MQGVLQERAPVRGRMLFVSNPDSDETRLPTLPPQPPPSTSLTPATAPHVPMLANNVRLLPQITTATTNSSPRPLPPSSRSSSSRSSPAPDSASTSSLSPVTPESPSSEISLDNVIIMVTSDHDGWYEVPLSGFRDGAAIREKIYAVLKVPDIDYDITHLFRYQRSEGLTGNALSNEELISQCQKLGDSSGTLRFAIETRGFPRSSAVRPPPAPAPQPFTQAPLRVVRDPQSLDPFGGYEASDEGSKRSIAPGHGKYGPRDVSQSPPNTAPPPMGIAWAPGGPPPANAAPLVYARSPGATVQTASRQPRALPQQPLPARPNHIRAPSDQLTPPGGWPAGSWAESPPAAEAPAPPASVAPGTSERLIVGMSIPRSASQHGPRAPNEWPQPTQIDTSIRPPPRNESREPIPATVQMQMSPSRAQRSSPIVSPSSLKLGQPPTIHAPQPPSNKAPLQLPHFIHTAPSNASLASVRAAQAASASNLPRPVESFPDQVIDLRPDPSEHYGRRPSVGAQNSSLYPPGPRFPMQSPLPVSSLSSNNNSFSRSGAMSPRSPAGASPRLVGARSSDNLRGGLRGVRPLPHGPMSIINRATPASIQTSSLSQQYPAFPSTSVSPVNTSTSSTLYSHRDAPTGIATSWIPTARRTNSVTTDTAPGVDLKRSGAISNGPRPATPTRNGRIGSVSDSGAPTSSPPSSGPIRIQGQAPRSPMNTNYPLSASPGRSRPPLPHLHVPTSPKRSNFDDSPTSGMTDSDGQPLSAAAHAHHLASQAQASLAATQQQAAVAVARRRGNPSPDHERELRERRYEPQSPTTNEDSTVLSTDPEFSHLVPYFELATTMPTDFGARDGAVRRMPSGVAGTPSYIGPAAADRGGSGSSRSGGSTTPRSRHDRAEESGTVISILSVSTSSTNDDDSSTSSSSSDSEEGTLWQRDIWQRPAPPLSAPTTLPPKPSTDLRPELSPLRTSFQDQDDAWLIRPKPEDLYDRLDTFFPKVNLDDPMIDSAPSPTSAEISQVFPPMSPTTAVPTMTTLPTSVNHTPQNSISDQPHQRSPSHSNINRNNRKSIRVVAEQRRNQLKNFIKSPLGGSKINDKALGRRTTKLWGNKVEELPPNTKTEDLPPIPSLPVSTTVSGRPSAVTFQWVRGDLIGKGTYGRVYHALNATTGEIMAVKQVELPKTASDHEDQRQKTVVEALKSESATLSILDHHHIVQYLGFEETPEFLSIFLEYVPGGSVGSCMRKYGKFSEDITKSFTRQVLDGLAYLHSVGILHRDLKGDNILVDPTGVCKISDFGISRHTEDIYHDASHTTMQGSIYWMAPEVISHGGYSAKIDVWSLGCLVLEMWAGRRPWNTETMFAVMYKLGTTKQAPPVPDDVELGELAEDFRQKCFAIDPNDRPTAAELEVHPYLVLPSFWRFPGFPKPRKSRDPWNMTDI